MLGAFFFLLLIHSASAHGQDSCEYTLDSAKNKAGMIRGGNYFTSTDAIPDVAGCAAFCCNTEGCRSFSLDIGWGLPQPWLGCVAGKPCCALNRELGPFVAYHGPMHVTTGVVRAQPSTGIRYPKLMGVLPFRPHNSSGRRVSVGGNHSLQPCVAACDATPGCQGFAPNSWGANMTSCQLYSNIGRLVQASCDSGAAQFLPFFSNPDATIPVPAPYQQFAGLMPLHRAVVAAALACNGDLSICTSTCDADPLCVGFQLAGCSPEKPGPSCWTMHREGAPSLVTNTLDHACYYQKPGVADVPAETASSAWTCSTPQCTFGCKFRQSQWSDGTPEFNCKMRKLAWQYGQKLRPDYSQFADLYYALGLNGDCEEEVPMPSFTTADQAPSLNCSRPHIHKKNSNTLILQTKQGKPKAPRPTAATVVSKALRFMLTI